MPSVQTRSIFERSAIVVRARLRRIVRSCSSAETGVAVRDGLRDGASGRGADQRASVAAHHREVEAALERLRIKLVEADAAANTASGTPRNSRAAFVSGNSNSTWRGCRRSASRSSGITRRSARLRSASALPGGTREWSSKSPPPMPSMTKPRHASRKIRAVPACGSGDRSYRAGHGEGARADYTGIARSTPCATPSSTARWTRRIGSPRNW